MEEIYDLFIRIFSGFFLLLILTRIIGKKQLGQLTIFTYITGIAIGNMAGEMIIHHDVKISEGIIGMISWVILILIIEYISLKSAKMRVLLDGEPTIVIKKGKIKYNELKRMRLNIDDLTMLLRTNNVFSIIDVEYAILEPNGDLSILKVNEKETVTKKDMNVQVTDIQYIPSEIISDGKIVYKNLKELGKTEQWVYEELEKAKIKDIKNVIYAELQTTGELYIQNEK